jgi:hypothetical protein
MRSLAGGGFLYATRVGLARNIVWFGLLAGCSYDPSPGRATTGDGPLSDGPLEDAATTADTAGDSAVIPLLVDRGLVVRYFMDEAASGQSPTSLTDSASSPLSVPITFGQASFIDENGHRGLNWPASQGSGKIELGLGSTKIQNQISPARTVTIEVVARIAGAGTAGSSNESQITGLRGGNPDFMLTAIGATDLRFFKPFGTEGATWVNVNNQQRMVLHLVFDTTRADAQQRIELFRNGGVITKTASSPPSQSSTVGLGSSDEFVIGNRQGSDRSIQGTIFYVAYYNVALAADEIANNAQRLLATDDL